MQKLVDRAKQIIPLISKQRLYLRFCPRYCNAEMLFVFGESTPFFLYYEELISSNVTSPSPLILALIQQYLHRSVRLQKRAVSAYQTIP